MKTQFLYHLREAFGCSPSDRLLLAVSGGIDSMVMLHLFTESGFSVEVAHCNFQLRGEAADGDVAFIEQYCKSTGIPFHVKKFDTAIYAEEKRLSIQMAARELRYTWFATMMEAGGYNFLATAHNLNDNLETVLLHLTKSTGFDGVKGIPEKNGNIIRPLLGFSRTQLEGYAKENNISWREDSSNASDDYQRNFIRHHVTPLLRQVNPALEEGFARTIGRVRAAGEIMEIGRRQMLADYVTKQPDGIRISKSIGRAFQYPAGVLWEILHTYGFNVAQCEDMVRSLDGNSGKRFRAGAFEAVIDRDEIILVTHPVAVNPVTIDREENQATLGSMYLSITYSTTFSSGENNLTACLDQDKIRFPLKWRSWVPGDSFQPLGMKGSKKISDFLIDNKVSLPDKERVTVLESNGEIVWVVGHRIDERYKITPETRQVLKLSVSSLFV